MIRKPICRIIFSCGHRGQRTLVTIERGEDVTNAYHIRAASAKRLSDALSRAFINGQYMIHPTSMGWTAYPIAGVKK